ncbi:MAG: DMT family transporter, partial [Thermodesulfobacteriota bacterium]|nr:DMT family transporter [Thermodesulfobacteriota bacterium]
MMKAWFLPAFLTLIFWGIWGFIPKLTTRYIDPMSAVVFEVAGAMLFGLFMLFFLKFHPATHPIGIGLALSTGILGMVGALFYLIAVSRGKVSVIVTVTALYPIVSIGLAHFILQEPITFKESIGII